MEPANFRMLIDGKLVEAFDTSPVVNSATGEIAWHAPDCDSATLDLAVAAARAAFLGWAAMPLTERRRPIESVAAAITEHGDELMRILTQEPGRPHDRARAEIMGSA